MQAYRAAEEIPPERLEECIHAFSSALRDRVRAEFPLPDSETIIYEVVTDKPWSGFNYYLGDYRSTVAVNADLKQQMSNLPRLVAHESYPGHHTEHCRKEAGLVGQARAGRADDLPGQHPAVPDGRGPGRPRAATPRSGRSGAAGPARSTPTSACASTVNGPRRCRRRRRRWPTSGRTRR